MDKPTKHLDSPTCVPPEDSSPVADKLLDQDLAHVLEMTTDVAEPADTLPSVVQGRHTQHPQDALADIAKDSKDTEIKDIGDSNQSFRLTMPHSLEAQICSPVMQGPSRLVQTFSSTVSSPEYSSIAMSDSAGECSSVVCPLYEQRRASFHSLLATESSQLQTGRPSATSLSRSWSEAATLGIEALTLESSSFTIQSRNVLSDPTALTGPAELGRETGHRVIFPIQSRNVSTHITTFLGQAASRTETEDPVILPIQSRDVSPYPIAVSDPTASGTETGHPVILPIQSRNVLPHPIAVPGAAASGTETGHPVILPIQSRNVSPHPIAGAEASGTETGHPETSSIQPRNVSDRPTAGTSGSGGETVPLLSPASSVTSPVYCNVTVRRAQRQGQEGPRTETFSVRRRPARRCRFTCLEFAQMYIMYLLIICAFLWIMYYTLSRTRKKEDDDPCGPGKRTSRAMREYCRTRKNP